MGVEDVSTYEQVLEFTDALMFPASQEASLPAELAPIAAMAGDLSIATVAPNVFTVESPRTAAAVAMEPGSAVAADPSTAPQMMQNPAATELEVTDQHGATNAVNPAQLAPVAEPQVEITHEQPTITVERAAPTSATVGATAVDEVVAHTGA